MGGEQWRYVYDAENRLAEVWRGSTLLARYRYDPDGERVVREVEGRKTVVVDDGYEVTPAGVRKTYRLGGEIVAVREGGAVGAVVGDHLGSVRVLAQGNTPTAAARYHPYGGIRAQSGPWPTDRRYTGQRWEGVLGLYDYRARFYDPALGRFLQPDPIVPEPGNPQSLNRYAYVLNNPLRYTDPTGHAECVDEECNWVVHPVSGRIIQRGRATSPPPPMGYDPAESVQQAWRLVGEWFFETDPEVRCFGPESSLTQDIMYDPGMTRFREAWAAAGHPLPWEWEHSADVREGGLWPIRIAKGGLVYIRENLELGLATIGLGSETPEGPIDAVGGIIGSLDKIYVKNAGGGLVRVEVINSTDWKSGTRIPGTNQWLLPAWSRNEVVLGGRILQHFYWWEVMPTKR